MSVLFIDFETRSACDIKAAGADAYARHPSTDLLCIGYAIDDDPVKIWIPKSPDNVWDFCLPADCTTVVAHNAPFEMAIWEHVCVKKYGFRPIPTERWVCTMSFAYAMALPGSLDKASAAAGLDHQKDMGGQRVMLQLSQPRDITPDGKVIWWEPSDATEKFERLYSYCKQDVEVERQLYKRLARLSDYERKVWLLDQKINQRGIKVDKQAIEAATQIVEIEAKRLDAEMRSVTGNAVATCKAVKQLTDWLKDCGVEVDGVAKNDVVELLASPTLPPACRKALLLRQEAAKSSTAKLTSMWNSACDDGRIRGIFQYHGASTGRWAGRRIQPQNFPRPKISQEQIEEVFSILERVQ